MPIFWQTTGGGWAERFGEVTVINGSICGLRSELENERASALWP